MTVQTVDAAEVVLSGLGDVGHGTVSVSGSATGLDRLPPSRVERSAPARARSAAAGRAGVIGFVGPRDTAPRAATPSRLRRATRALRPHLGTLAGVTILGVLLWRLGTGVFLDGLRRIDATTLLVGLGIGLLTTGFSAWRWALVARRLQLRLPLVPAIADYYRSLFLNAALPGGVLGDVHRAVRHGQSTGDVKRGVRAVVLERVAGQIALITVGGAVLLTLPSPVLAEARRIALMAAFAAAGAVAVLVAVRMNRAPSAAARRARALRAVLTEARGALFSRENLPGVALSSLIVLSGHLGMFVVAARVAGSSASVAELLPIAVLALLAMGLPLNVGGWGPREGVTAWAFGAAGLGASMGLSVAVVYGVLSFVAALPGAVVLVVRYFWSPAEPAESAEPAASAPAPAPASASVSIEKYAPKDSAKLASNAFPFSAEPSEGRPMTPESV
ncbi:lysylphosphatidylglycerol synthase transmembrane domain-containing protein [Streptomyces turgidiscabies]|uniref:Putative membrane protein n=1 Tax=Streptomyces turgidiscabies (strain Car8) TaxID=698760 RepID=L7FKH0_STRT8|nr:MULTISPECIES: lysylphosphatidylglycerol synthase transmembrane domain-containing protein [Streptomyces]ELP71170.1 putative membrane protein [Streptomyces turgidiscabies Car8]MDX3491327.1 lysylphosphatidylglycerol synthase transmembrane domain-containing protein [Streptomyces turgidiscabies]GAQ77034.1 hypothetical protein T45_08846 [Streptomyces turgidiscabies]